MITVLGATGKTGGRLVARLCAENVPVTAVARSAARLGALPPAARRVVTELNCPDAVSAALAGANCVVNCANVRHSLSVLHHLPPTCERLVLMGSTRAFRRLPDPAGDAVRDIEAAFLASGVPGVMLHPSMIYGPPDDGTVDRLLRLVQRVPIIPLPGGGRALVQPVFIDDVVEALFAAATRPEAPGPSIVVAGPLAISYADMVRACVHAVGRSVVIVPVPGLLLVLGIRLATLVGVSPPVDSGEIARMLEDQAFDVSDMRTRLGVAPRPFGDGLRLKLERGWVASLQL